MKERTLQILRYLAVPCVFGCLNLSADTYRNSDDMSSSQDKGHFISTYERLKGKELSPEAGVVVSGGVDVYVQADYIYWHASEGGLQYVESAGSVPIATAATSNNSLSQGIQLAPHFKMSSGFKVGLGLDFNYDGWDMGAMYTWLRPHAYSSFDAAERGTQNVSLWLGNPTILATGVSTETIIGIGTPRDGSADWKLHFNVVDLELGRSFFVSPRLVMRPHFGLKGTWDTQRYNVFYTNTNGVSVLTGTPTASTAVETYNINQHQSYWGVGPRAGTNTSWMVTRNFSFFGNWSLAALWGQFKTTRTDTSDVATAAGTALLTNFTPINVRARTHQISPVLEMEIGLRYDYWFCDDEYRFRLAASWENQLWFNQNHFVGLAHGGVLGDLSLQGLTVNVRFDF